MSLPTIGDALAQIHKLADEDHVGYSRNAGRDIDGLDYELGDVCDMLYALEEDECEKIEPGKWTPEHPVLTFVTEFSPDGRDDFDQLFVEVSVRPDELYVLACKLDGSPR